MSQLTLREQQVLTSHRSLQSNQVIRKTYSGQVLAVYQSRILGAGNNHQQALSKAMTDPDCPNQDQLTFVPIS